MQRHKTVEQCNTSAALTTCRAWKNAATLASKGKLKLSQTISGTQDSAEDASKLEKSFHGGSANGVQVRFCPKALQCGRWG